MCGMEYRLKKGSVYEGKVEKVDFPNKATVWVTDEDGQKEKAIVKNAIPGQTVRFCVNKKRKGHCEGRLMEVVEKSPLETNPACPHFGKCGGCTYQTVAYEEQLKIKSTQVEKLIREVVSGELPFEGIIGSPVTEEYRNFHLAMSTRTDLLHSDFTNETACMILFQLQNVRLLMRITERFSHAFRIMQ